MAYAEYDFAGLTDVNGNATIDLGPLPDKGLYFLGYAVVSVGGGQACTAVIETKTGYPLAAASGLVPTVGPVLIKPNDFKLLQITAAPGNTAFLGNLIGDVAEKPGDLLVRPQPTQAGTTVSGPTFPTLKVTGLAEFLGLVEFDSSGYFYGPDPFYDPRHPNHAGGAKGDGVTDDYGPIQDCLTLANAAGGGWVKLSGTPGMVYAVKQGLQQSSGVRFTFDPGVSIKYTGPAPVAGTTFELLDTPFIPQVVGLEFDGLLDCNNVAGVYGLHMHSLQWSRIRARIQNVAGVDAAGGPLPAALIAADVAAAGPGPLFQAVAVNDIDILVQSAPMILQYRGVAGRAPATLNRWGHIFGTFTKTGIDFIETCDSNSFDRIDLIAEANNAKYMILNDLAPANVDHDVKGLKFGQITFTAQGGATGGTGLTINWVTSIDFGQLFYDASAFAGGGALVNDVSGHGYQFDDGGEYPPRKVWQDIAFVPRGQATIYHTFQDPGIAGGNLIVDPSLGELIDVFLNGNVTILAPTVPPAAANGGTALVDRGRVVWFRFQHDNTANAYVIIWNAIYKKAAGAFANTNLANAIDIIGYASFDGVNWYELGRALHVS